MTTPRVLISDALSPAAVQIFKDRGVDVDFQPDLGKDKDKLAAVIGDYDGLAIRSATKVTAKILEQAKNLKVIGRAGIGVDNVEIPAATAKGIIVMNTPFGNSITTAEHAIAMMFALARQIPQADASTQAGKWEKNRFMGVELTGKTLGVIGCGNIGSIVADRGIGLRMRVIALRPVPVAGARDRARRREGRARRSPAPRRRHHPARADDREDEEHPVRGEPRQDARRACASSTAPAAASSTRRPCARRSIPAMWPAPPSTCSPRSRRPRTRSSAIPTSSARPISAPRPRKRRRTSPCRSPSRCPTTCCRARSRTPSTSRRSPPRRRRASSPSWRSPRSSARSSASSPRRRSRASASSTRARSRT